MSDCQTKLPGVFYLLIVVSFFLSTTASLGSECGPIRDSLEAKKLACGVTSKSDDHISSECESELIEIRDKLSACRQEEYHQKRAARAGKKASENSEQNDSH